RRSGPPPRNTRDRSRGRPHVAAGRAPRGSSAEEALQVAQVVAERRGRGGGRDGHDEGHAVARFTIAPSRPQREARAEHDRGGDEQAMEGNHGGAEAATLSTTMSVSSAGR